MRFLLRGLNIWYTVHLIQDEKTAVLSVQVALVGREKKRYIQDSESVIISLRRCKQGATNETKGYIYSTDADLRQYELLPPGLEVKPEQSRT